MKIFLNGAEGRMGKAIAAIAPDEKAILSIAATHEQPQLEAIDTCDVVLDFSSYEATLAITAAAAAAEAAAAVKSAMVVARNGTQLSPGRIRRTGGLRGVRPMPIERRRKPSVARMAKRGFLRASEGRMP